MSEQERYHATLQALVKEVEAHLKKYRKSTRRKLSEGTWLYRSGCNPKTLQRIRDGQTITPATVDKIREQIIKDKQEIDSER